jgi:hypothetical protein
VCRHTSDKHRATSTLTDRVAPPSPSRLCNKQASQVHQNIRAQRGSATRQSRTAPLKTLALESFAQSQATADVTETRRLDEIAAHVVVKLGVLVKPHRSNAIQVVSNSLQWVTILELVRRLLAKGVSNVRARHSDELSSTHPQPKRHFKVLSSPRVLVLVVRPGREEELTAHGKQPASHHGRSVVVVDGLLGCLLVARFGEPVKVPFEKQKRRVMWVVVTKQWG